MSFLNELKRNVGAYNEKEYKKEREKLEKIVKYHRKDIEEIENQLLIMSKRGITDVTYDMTGLELLNKPYYSDSAISNYFTSSGLKVVIQNRGIFQFFWGEDE